MLESGFYNMDCMDGMAQFPDKFFELAIVDPPYGIGASRATGTYAREATNYSAATDKKWDEEIPSERYFKELFRVSINQIIWGGNYMVSFLPSSQGWICWYKTDELKGRDFSEFELAYTSFKRAARHFEHRPFIRNGERIHPTQKPIALYKWLLSNYAKPGDKILDTHVGSASSLIACHQMGFEYWGFELDADYYMAATERLNKVKAQVSMTELIEPPQIDQIKIV